MSWSLPRLLRRLRPELGHFQHALPLGFGGPSVVTLHDLHFERDPSVMSRRRPVDLQGGRAPGREARRPGDRCLRTHEARCDRAVRHSAGEDHRHPARRRPGCSRRATVRTAAICSSSVPSRRARDPLAAPRLQRRSGCRFVVAGPGEGAGPRARAALTRRRRARLRSISRSSSSSIAAQLRFSCRRGTRGSACRCSRRWRAACRSCSRPTLRCARSRATPACMPTTATSPARSGARSPTARGSCSPASNAPGASPGTDGSSDRRGLPEGARVKVAAVVVSHGHPHELEQSLPALRDAGRRARRDREHSRLGAAGRRGPAQRQAARIRREREPRRRAHDGRPRGEREPRRGAAPGAVAALRGVHDRAPAVRDRRAAHGVPRRHVAALAAALSDGRRHDRPAHAAAAGRAPAASLPPRRVSAR